MIQNTLKMLQINIIHTLHFTSYYLIKISISHILYAVTFYFKSHKKNQLLFPKQLLNIELEF
jgi:hypothetical protein